MRLVLTAWGSKGDLFPVLGLGRAVRARGHSVTILSGNVYEDEVREAGLDFFAACSTEEHELVRRALRGLGRTTRPVDVDRVLDITMDGVYRAIEATYVPGETVLAATEQGSPGVAGLAREKLGVPHASVWVNNAFLFFAPWYSRATRPVEDRVRNAALRVWWLTRKVVDRYAALRDRLGLPPDRDFVRSNYSPDLNIGLLPRWFAPRFHAQLPNAVLTGFPLYAGSQNRPLAPELLRFLDNGDPPVVFVTTSARAAADYFRASAAACRALGVRGVLLTQTSEPVLSGTDRVSSIIELPYAAHNLLLPRARALVHHAGLGTMSQAMACGLPQLAVPQGLDMPANARWVRRLGVGLASSHDRYMRHATELLRSLLQSERIRDTARRRARELAGPPDFQEAIDRLERLSQKQPREAARRAGLARAVAGGGDPGESR